MDRACLLEALHESLYIYCWRDLFCLKREKNILLAHRKNFFLCYQKQKHCLYGINGREARAVIATLKIVE